LETIANQFVFLLIHIALFIQKHCCGTQQQILVPKNKF